MVEHVGVTDELIGIRHYLHQHPERSFKEVETSAYLARLLRGHGIDVLDTTLETGVVALIEGEVPGPRIALRADIDGLPITEDTGLPFSSLNPGVMHGCGHDLHMTGLLGAAFWLADHRDRIAGSVKIVFQPAEEVGLGARTVVESDATDDVKAIIGTHNNPNYAPGQIAIGPQPIQPMMVASSRPGHPCRYPQKGTGPIEALASMIAPADHREPQHRRSTPWCCPPKCMAGTCGTAIIGGTHNNPNYAPGQIAIGPQPMMAGCVKFKVTLHAQGTHAGYPQKGTGPIEALASMILALQTIVSRNISPFHAVVLSITEVHGGHVWNVVPAEAGFQGTVRFFDQDDERLVHRRFVAEVEHTAEAYGIAADVDWDCIQVPLVGDEELSEAVAADVPSYAALKPTWSYDLADARPDDLREPGRRSR